MVFTLWTDDPALAAAAACAGVGRIGPDLERLGKRRRQPAPGHLFSGHSPAALASLRQVIGAARLHVRTNPPHPGLAGELEACLEAGVTSMMLPMVRRVSDAREVVERIRGRAEVIVMVEHADALPIVDELVALDGVADIYVGVNDLALSLGLPSRFDVLASGVVDAIAESVHRRGLGFGFFGLARPGDTDLPVPSDLVYADQARLGATSFILARSFRATAASIGEGMASARARLEFWRSRPDAELAAAHAALQRHCGLMRTQG